MTNRRRIPLAAAAVAALAACGADGPAAGSERGPCYGNGSCDDGLVCASDHCVKSPDPPDSGIVDAAIDGSLEPPDAALPDAALDAAVLPGDCGAPIVCPTPVGSKVTVCGRIFDVGSGEPISAPSPVGALCDPGAPTTSGPCALTIEMFDPLAFAANPTGTAPLAADEIAIDDCGRYRAVNVTRPFNGYMAVVVDDAAALYAQTAVTFPIDMGETRAGSVAAATLQATDTGWTITAGDPFGGITFAEKGVVLYVFLYAGVPVAGVIITRSGAVRPVDDYYFAASDVGAMRTTVAAGETATGPNGAALLVNSSLAQHSGTGAEPSGCEWPSELAAAIPGVVFYAERNAHVVGDPGTSCP